MLFNSIDFALFLPIVWVLFWISRKNIKLQNIILLVASYIFYGWWDYRFLALIAISSLVDYLVGLQLAKNHKKRWLLISLVVNLGMLGFFKYADFFAQSFADAFTFFGSEINPKRLNIILPVGISFYTFQTLSYSLDIYHQKIKPTKSLISFLAFVSFFPQLVAGPIERASKLLPQFEKLKKMDLNFMGKGLQQMLWGFFKKMVIADNCAILVDQVFNSPGDHNGWSLLLGAFFFAFQIYGDFSGYSDIAIGTAKLFGFRLSQNFAFPYFSRDIAEFWRRWHISLSSWFKDYLYIPLGGSKLGKKKALRNIYIIFLVSGLWHGANWTFIAWGAVHAFLFIPLFVLGKNRQNTQNDIHLSFVTIYKILTTFLQVSLAWILFRAQNLEQVFLIYKQIFHFSNWGPSTYQNINTLLVMLGFLLVVEWMNKTEINPLERLNRLPKLITLLFYGFVLFCISMFSPTQEMPFIYFQF